MKTEKDINHKILEISMTIEETYPELLIFIGEMQGNNSYSQGAVINAKTLMNYCDSLEAMLKRYAQYHQ